MARSVKIAHIKNSVRQRSGRIVPQHGHKDVFVQPAERCVIRAVLRCPMDNASKDFGYKSGQDEGKKVGSALGL